MKEKRSLQFELWEECNNHCAFCYLKDKGLHTSSSVKIKSLEKTLDMISDDAIFQHYDVLSYIGGEFFQGQLNSVEVKDKFFQLIRRTDEIMQKHLIDEFWLNATLISEKQDDLISCLNVISDKSKIWICTSYDTIGRFHTTKAEQQWKDNMHMLNTAYPQLKFNVTLIVTQDLIQQYLSEHFSFNKFYDEFSCSIFLKTPYACAEPQTIADKIAFEKQAVPNFFPRRNDFLKFLAKLSYNNPELLDKLYNIRYRADDLYKNTEMNKTCTQHFKRIKDYNMTDIMYDNNDILSLPTQKCGHRTIYAPYIDSDHCFICDKNALGL